MRRLIISMSFSVIVLLGLLASGVSTRAQDATPDAMSAMMASGETRPATEWVRNAAAKAIPSATPTTSVDCSVRTAAWRRAMRGYERRRRRLLSAVDSAAPRRSPATAPVKARIARAELRSLAAVVAVVNVCTKLSIGRFCSMS